MLSVCRKSVNSTGMAMTATRPFTVRVLGVWPAVGRGASITRRRMTRREARERMGFKLFDLERQLPPPGIVDAQRRRIPVGIAENHHYPPSHVKQILIRRVRIAG